jgi:hypothetical protein
MTTSRFQRWRGVVVGIASRSLLVLSSGIGGALLGSLYVRLLVPRTGMGWDQLADALGGFMVGGLLGLAAGGVGAARLGVRGRRLATALAIGAAIASLVGLRLMADGRS